MQKVKSAILLLPLRILGQPRTMLSEEDGVILHLDGQMLRIDFNGKDRPHRWLIPLHQIARLDMEVEDE